MKNNLIRSGNYFKCIRLHLPDVNATPSSSCNIGGMNDYCKMEVPKLTNNTCFSEIFEFPDNMFSFSSCKKCGSVMAMRYWLKCRFKFAETWTSILTCVAA